MVCGETLEYHATARDVACSYCNRSESGHITCPASHFICDTCHNHDAMRVIEEVIMTSRESDPVQIAELAMSFPGLPMLGCQHAYIAGGALMAGIKNNDAKNISNEDIREVFSRTRKQAHGGYCGLTDNLSRFHDNVARLESGGAHYTGQPVEEDNNIISCSGPASSLEVALRLVEKLTGKQNAHDVKKLMIGH